MINPRAGQWALSRVVQEYSPLNPASGIFLTAARRQGLADTVDCYYSPLALSNTDYAIGFALVRLDGNVIAPDADTVFLPGLDTTLRDLRNPERNALRSFLAANLGDYSYRDWAGIVRNKLAFGDRSYLLDTPIRQIVTDVFDFLEHGNPFDIPGDPEVHNTEYTDNFSTDPYSAPRWVNHGETIAWDSTNQELDIAHAGATVLERYSANNSGSIDHEAQVTCYSQTSPTERRVTGAAVRMYGTNPDAYCIYGDNSSDNVYFGRFNSGTLTEISSTAYTFDAGFYTFCLAAEVSGTDDVALSGWIQSEGASKPSDPGWITNVGSETHTYTDTSANRLNNASNHTDCGIGSNYAINRDYDTQLCYFKLRAVSDRSGGATLTIADAAHGHTADNMALTQVHSLVVADSTHGHTADNVVLTQAHALVVADSAHAHNTDNIALTQVHVLVVADATHSQTADNVTLSAGGALDIAEAVHAHSADNLALTQVHNLAVNDATHAHAADNIALAEGASLIITDASHAHVADSPVLTQAHLLAIQESLHAHGVDNIDLTQAHVLIISDALHAHLAAACNLYPGVIQTADERTLVIRAEGRTLVVTTEDRILIAKAETRTLQ